MGSGGCHGLRECGALIGKLTVARRWGGEGMNQVIQGDCLEVTLGERFNVVNRITWQKPPFATKAEMFVKIEASQQLSLWEVS